MLQTAQEEEGYYEMQIKHYTSDPTLIHPITLSDISYLIAISWTIYTVAQKE